MYVEKTEGMYHNARLRIHREGALKISIILRTWLMNGP